MTHRNRQASSPAWFSGHPVSPPARFDTRGRDETAPAPPHPSWPGASPGHPRVLLRHYEEAKPTRQSRPSILDRHAASRLAMTSLDSHVNSARSGLMGGGRFQSSWPGASPGHPRLQLAREGAAPPSRQHVHASMPIPSIAVTSTAMTAKRGWRRRSDARGEARTRSPSRSRRRRCRPRRRRRSPFPADRSRAAETGRASPGR